MAVAHLDRDTCLFVLKRVYLRLFELPRFDTISKEEVNFRERTIFRLWEAEVCPKECQKTQSRLAHSSVYKLVNQCLAISNSRRSIPLCLSDYPPWG